MWNELKLWQVQAIDEVRRKATKETLEIDVESKIISIVNEMDINEVHSMKWVDYLEERKRLSFLETEPDPVTADFIKAGKRRYRVVYDVKSMPFARYVESKTFAQDFVPNLHKALASMVVPQKRNWFGKWVDADYESDQHERYAEDMREAPYVLVYGIAVFFFHLYRIWMHNLKDLMIAESQQQGASAEEATEQVNSFLSNLDGSTMPIRFPSSRA